MGPDHGAEFYILETHYDLQDQTGETGKYCFIPLRYYTSNCSLPPIETLKRNT